MIRGALYSIPAAKVWKINFACNSVVLLIKCKSTADKGGRTPSVGPFLPEDPADEEEVDGDGDGKDRSGRPCLRYAQPEEEV